MTGREFSLWLFEKQNWRWILAISIASILGFALLTIDDGLWDQAKRDGLADVLEDEQRNLELPKASSVIDHEKISKSHSVLVSTDYRTELLGADFLKSMNNQLVVRGWIYRSNEDEGSFHSYHYCRGRFDATLTRRKSGLFDDGNGDWSLYFTYYARVKLGFLNTRPDGCKE